MTVKEKKNSFTKQILAMYQETEPQLKKCIIDKPFKTYKFKLAIKVKTYFSIPLHSLCL